ncbi:MAG: hypothetical protein ACRDZ8_11135 [Acidimicrobiales bacterium]
MSLAARFNHAYLDKDDYRVPDRGLHRKMLDVDTRAHEATISWP